MMKYEDLGEEVSKRICNHMNSDHKKAVMQYASHYGKQKNFKKAIITDITSTHLELKVDNKTIQIKFDHTLLNSADAHKTLVSMLKAIPK